MTERALNPVVAHKLKAWNLAFDNTQITFKLRQQYSNLATNAHVISLSSFQKLK